ncbi:ROK family protein [Ornithinimicrobium pekingense]|uniref:Transcriptional regulator n=1 Tax=Ornithinimicrobium pekingense TaxID=384677 RepID=A0ABQ2FBC9_9MICO|nr:ROK family protein [Ornithinimicrobium pekingense]GGK77682.1 transcriptional regulator [Ornithinimicrobium pekingense]
MNPTLAVDIGGTKIAAGLVPGHGGGTAVEHLTTVPTPAAEGGEAVVQAALGAARTVLDAAAEPPARVGISSAGTVEPGTGRVTHATNLILGWAGTPLGERFTEALGMPTAVLNDVHAHGLGEVLGGAATGTRSALVVAIGTGIGGCHVVDGAPVLGARGVAGHVGHVPVAEASGLRCSCGHDGHLEALASGTGVAAEMQRRTGRRLSGREVAALAGASADAVRADAVQRDDPDAPVAREVLALAGRATGRALGGLLNVLDPQVLVVGGGLSQAGGPWRQALLEGVREQAMDVVADVPVRFSDLGVQAALRGAAHWATEHCIP